MYFHLVQEDNLCLAFEMKARYSVLSNLWTILNLTRILQYENFANSQKFGLCEICILSAKHSS